jgi:Ca-activated chloride channel homolog
MTFRELLVGAILCLLAGPAAAQDHATILVLDGSGSMWAELPEGRSRIEVARDVLGDFLTSRDPEQPLGVIAYGHNRRGDCADIETIARVERQDPIKLGTRLRELMPRGKTPISDALRLAVSEIPPTAEEADIVLITDGLETCGGDVCAVAAELGLEGVPIRAHVVGFGLSEGDIRQIACIAEETGGMLLATQSGAELADALARTATPVTREAVEPGRAALDLTILADRAGRPDSVDFTAENLASGEELALGTLDFAADWVLPVELHEGRWRIVADAGDKGHGEMELDVVGGENRTIHVPFTGIMPRLTIDQVGPYRVSQNAIFPARITQEGLATGGADFVLSLLPPDAQSLNDRAITWSAQDGSIGDSVAALSLPADPGRYRVAYHRYGEVDLANALAVLDIQVVARPEVKLSAPAAVEPGAPVRIAAQGGGAPNDRIEIWRDGALVSWDQSAYLEEMFDNSYGPAKILPAPAEAGAYEIVYLFSGLDGDDAIAARLPLSVGAVTPTIEEGALQGGTVIRQAAAERCDDDTGCAMGEDAPQPGSGVVQVVIAANGAEGSPVEWNLLPIGRPAEDVIASSTAITGPWTTALDIGEWGVNGIAEGATYFGQITVAEGGNIYFGIDRVMPGGTPPVPAAQIGYICDQAYQCIFEDSDVQILGALPAGWAFDIPTREGYVAGGDRGFVRMSFFRSDAPEPTITLNPRQWIDANGTCADVQAGILCQFAPATAETQAAFDLLKLSLRDTAPRNLPSPGDVLRNVMGEIAGEDPNAAAAMGALMEAAGNGQVPDANAMAGMIGSIMSGGTPADTGVATQIEAAQRSFPMPGVPVTEQDFDALRRSLMERN